PFTYAPPGRVLVAPPGNTAMEVALGTKRSGRLGNVQFKTPDILATEDYKRDADSGAYNLVIYDQCAPATMPRSNTLFIGRLPPGRTWRGGDAAKEEADAKDKDATKDKEKEAAPEQDADLRVGAPQILDWDR